LYYIDLSNDNIVDINSDHSQVLRIDCDAPVTTDLNTELKNVKTHNRTTQKTNNMSETDLTKKPEVNSGYALSASYKS